MQIHEIKAGSIYKRHSHNYAIKVLKIDGEGPAAKVTVLYVSGETSGRQSETTLDKFAEWAHREAPPYVEITDRQHQAFAEPDSVGLLLARIVYTLRSQRIVTFDYAQDGAETFLFGIDPTDRELALLHEITLVRKGKTHKARPQFCFWTLDDFYTLAFALDQDQIAALPPIPGDQTDNLVAGFLALAEGRIVRFGSSHYAIAPRDLPKPDPTQPANALVGITQDGTIVRLSSDIHYANYDLLEGIPKQA